MDVDVYNVKFCVDINECECWYTYNSWIHPGTSSDDCSCLFV